MSLVNIHVSFYACHLRFSCSIFQLKKVNKQISAPSRKVEGCEPEICWFELRAGGLFGLRAELQAANRIATV